MKDFLRGAVFVGIFAVPFIPLIIANSMFFPFITGKNFAFRIIVEIMLAAWLILALYEPRYRPKFSWIFVGLAALVVVMFFANLFGMHPPKSFWSNFERMDGYVTLVHFFLYTVIAGTMLTTEKLWDRFFNTTLFAAVILTFYSFSQLAGNIEITQGSWRLTGTLGNAAYMAVYMLFHAFIAAFMFTRTRSQYLKMLYGGLVLIFVYLLIQTATRGAILGLAGGAILSTLYIALFAKGSKQIRKAAGAGLGIVIVLIGLFIAFKDASFIQENRYLSRVANITLEEGDIRFMIWDMALTGVQERPLLGWGQGNFNYIFNSEYNPDLYNAEPWYDRVHNIVLDWLVAGGVLGALAYFSILAAALYYIVVRPVFKRDNESFTVLESGLLLGLLAAYVFHNLFVFDNIVSYIYFGTILAFIHSRVGTEIPKLIAYRVDQRIIENIAAPVIGITLVGVVYVVNVPGIQAAGDIIDAFRAETPEGTLAEFNEALERDSFGDQEVREQMTRQMQSFIRSGEVSQELRTRMMDRTEEELMTQIEEKPDDARVHVFVSSFYRSTNQFEEAVEQLARARELSPNKQQIIYEQGLVELQQNNFEEALGYFREAYELQTENSEARVFYAAAAFYAGELELANSLIETEQHFREFGTNQLAVQAAYQAQDHDFLERVFETVIESAPQNVQYRVNLAVTHFEQGEEEEAIGVLETAIEEIPNFKAQGEQFIADIRAGRVPGSQPTPEVEVQGEAVEAEVDANGPTQPE